MDERALTLRDYEVTWTPAERTRLYQIFPQGVCNWSLAGVGQRGLADTWIDFTDVGGYRIDLGD